MDIFSVISLLGGLAMFLYGMEVMGDGLKNSSGEALKRVLEKVTQNPVIGVITGTLVTAVIQSSTATIVLTVALIGAGILNLRQAVSIVLGANIGTTITAQMIRLMDIDAKGSILAFFKPNTLAPVALIIGIIFLLFIKKNSLKGAGEILIGFGVLFIGLLNMTDSVSALSESPAFIDAVTNFSGKPVLGIIVGFVTTVIVQSSSAMVGVLQALSVTGAITFDTVYPIIMGINLGTCATTAIVCSIGSSKDSKRVGFVHIVFNTIGTILFMIVMSIIKSAGGFATLWGSVADSGLIADFQTIFNLITAIVLLPFTNLLVSLSLKAIPVDKEEEIEDFSGLNVLDEKLFISPAVALEQCRHAICRMSELAKKNFADALKQMTDYSEDRAARIANVEDKLDVFTDTAENFLIKLSPLILSDNDNNELNLLLEALKGYERIGDYANHINELGAQRIAEEINFSLSAQNELKIVSDAINELLSRSADAFISSDNVSARRVEPLEEVIDDICSELRVRHLDRLKAGKCSITAGLIFIECLTNIERAADQCSDIGVFVLGRHDSDVLKDRQGYLRSVHKGSDPIFVEEYASNKELYTLPVFE